MLRKAMCSTAVLFAVAGLGATDAVASISAKFVRENAATSAVSPSPLSVSFTGLAAPATTVTPGVTPIPLNTASGNCLGTNSCYVSFIMASGTVKGIMSGAAGSATASTTCPVPYVSCTFEFIGTSNAPIYNYGLSGPNVSVISVF
jgi:hypothetical protein